MRWQMHLPIHDHGLTYNEGKRENLMCQRLTFETRTGFRQWLKENYASDEGIWLLFAKGDEIETLSANDALEEALCFGWIDGQMKRIDDTRYQKYFTKRRPHSNWSERNKKLVSTLEAAGLMTEFGRMKIEEAKENGQWDKPQAQPVTDSSISDFEAILELYEPAYTNFKNMSPSVRRTYTRAYFDAKTEKGRVSRLEKIVDRLNQNLKPM